MSLPSEPGPAEAPLTYRRRPDKTYSKHIMLTDYGRQQIQAWADAQQLNFSAAIESLALLGLEDERAAYVIPALRAVTFQALRLVFNRMGKLLADIALEAAAARTTSETILLQLIRQQAEQQPDDFAAAMRVRVDGRHPRDAGIRALHEEIKGEVARLALARLQAPTAHLQALWGTPAAPGEDDHE